MTGEAPLFEPITWRALSVNSKGIAPQQVTVAFTEQSLIHILEQHVLPQDWPWAGWWGTAALELATRWYKGRDIAEAEITRLRHELEGKLGKMLRASLHRPMVLIRRRR